MKRTVLTAGLLLCTLLVSIVFAVRHGLCSRCGKMIVLDEEGIGLDRDWRGLCGQCAVAKAVDKEAEEDETPTETVKRLGIETVEFGGIRFVKFHDGTVIDLGHFMATADVATAFGACVSNIAGWIMEVKQWAEGNPSGKPFGGNEDLQSNADGADFGDEHLTDDGNRTVGQQIGSYLESEHGGVVELQNTDGNTVWPTNGKKD